MSIREEIQKLSRKVKCLCDIISNQANQPVVTPSLEQVLNVDNTSNRTDSDVHIKLIDPSTQTTIYSHSTQYINTTTGESAYSGLSGFNNTGSDNRLAQLGYTQGLKLKTLVTGGIAAVKSDLLTVDRNFQFPDISGTLGLEYFLSITPDSYIGKRISPLLEYNGFIVNKSANQNIGYRAVNPDNAGNGALAGFTVAGAGGLYENGSALQHFGAAYFIPYFAGNGAVLSNKKLLVGTTGGSDLEFFTGTTSSNVTAKLIVKNNGQIEITTLPTAGNSSQFLSRLSDGKLVTVTNTVTNSTTNALSLSDLNTQYPNATIGFRVQCTSIAGGALVYEKTSSGWISVASNIVS